MPYLLNILYLALFICALPWLVYRAVRHGKYRDGWSSKWLGRVPVGAKQRPRVWLHAVSVGEANLLQTIVPRLEQAVPGVECVISVTTRTAFELASRRFAPRTVFYCPLDFSWAVRAAMRRIQPDLLVLTELELWPNLIHLAKQHGAAIALINARMSDRSFHGYRRVRPLAARMLAALDLVAAQNPSYAERFRRLGAVADRVHVTGSVKFDGARSDRDNPDTRRLAQLAGIQRDDIVFLAGSTQAPEEAMAVEVYRQLVAGHPQLRLIVVPRHPERFAEVAALLDRSGLRWQRRTSLDGGADPAARVLLVDTIGELAAWWGTAHIAFVGGSMGTRGGQNMIEPAAYGAAVCFGPNTRNFRDVVQLMLAAGAAKVVRDSSELADFVRWCLEHPDQRDQMGQRAAQLVRQQQGAADRTTALVAELLRRRLDRQHPRAAA